jgi:hypothetical protein
MFCIGTNEELTGQVSASGFDDRLHLLFFDFLYQLLTLQVDEKHFIRVRDRFFSLRPRAWGVEGGEIETETDERIFDILSYKLTSVPHWTWNDIKMAGISNI